MMNSNLNLNTLPECKFAYQMVNSALLIPCIEYQRVLHPKTITQLAQKDTGSSANRHMRQILRIYNGASREMSLPLKN